jgi:hypothetical protein
MAIYDLKANLDLKQNMNVYATCKQLDNLNLILSIYDNSVQVDLSSYTVRLKAMKADKVPLVQHGTGISISNNVVTIECDEQLTTTSGKTLIELQFIDNSTAKKKATFNLVLIVIASTLADGATISKSTYTLLEELENKMDQASNFFENIDEAITANNNLQDSISTGNTLKTNLDNNITTGNTLNNDLETNISAGNILKPGLEGAVTSANTAKAELDISIQDANTFVSEHGDIIDLDNRVTQNTSQLNENANDISNIKTDYAKKDEVNTLASNKAEKTDLETINNRVTNNTDDLAIQKSQIINLTKVQNSGTEDNTELLDLRIKADGSTSPTAGNAVREQFRDVKSLAGKRINLFDCTQFGLNKYPKDTVGTSTINDWGSNTDSWYSTQHFRVKKGDIIITNIEWMGFYIYNSNGILVETKHTRDLEYTVTAIDAHFFIIYYAQYHVVNPNSNVMVSVNNPLPNTYCSYEDISMKTVESKNLDSRISIIEKCDFNFKPTITLIDDDTTYSKIPTLKSICDDLGIKCTFACISGHLDDGATNASELLSLLKQYQNEGFHITSHSWGHNEMWQWKDLTENQKRTLYNDLLKSFSDLESKGFLDCKMFVSPGGGHLPNVQKLVSGWADCLVNAGDDNDVIFYNKGYQNGKYNLYRVFINADKHSDLSYYTNLIDEAKKNNAWLIFGTHSGAYSWSATEFNEDLVRSVMQYAVDSGIQIETLNKAFKKRKLFYDMYEMYNG